MSWRLDNRRRFVLLLLAVIALLLQGLLDATRTPTRQRDHALKIAAAERAEQAFTAIREVRLMDRARLDLVNDPAGTGLIGPQFSLITNARGDLDAKLTSLNPNFAGLLVQFFREAGLKAGDKVAVAVSGSFPGMNIGLFAALETLELDPVVITSVGASMWGANNPEFTWLDMERLFTERGIFQTHSLAATYGGANDMGRGLSPEGRQLIQAAIDRNGVPLLASDNIQDAIEKRLAFYLEKAGDQPYRMYVNVGGGVASIGSSSNRLLLPHGLNFDLQQHNWPRKGNLIQFAEMGVPTIHLLGITGLAREYGLPIAPDYQPQPGEGEIFVRDMYRLPLAMGILTAYCLLCVLVLAPEIRHGLFDRLTRRPPVRPMLLMVLVSLGLAATPSSPRAATRWISVKPRDEGASICLRSSQQEFAYQILDEREATYYRVNGSRPLKIIARYIFEPGENPRQVFTLIARLDGQEVLRKTFRARPHADVAVCDDQDRMVSALRRAGLETAKGRHDIELLAASEGKGRIAVRLFRETHTKNDPLVSFQPQQYQAVATLQFESGSQSTYYRFEAGHPLVFRLSGPITVRLYTRLDFGHTMNGDQEYGLEILRDDLPWRTFQFHTRELSSASYVERPDLLPGVRKSMTIEVPEGPHTFEVRCLHPAACGVAAQIRIPEKALEVRR